MHAWVEDANCLTADINGIRNKDRPSEHACDAFGDRTLPVAGLPIQQDGVASVHRRADQPADLATQLKVCKGAVNTLGCYFCLANGLVLNYRNVISQRYRRWTNILIAFKCLCGLFITLVCQRVLILLFNDAPGADRL